MNHVKDQENNNRSVNVYTKRVNFSHLYDAKLAELFEGFFVGTFDFHGMTEFEHCLSHANLVEQHFKSDKHGFLKGPTKRSSGLPIRTISLAQTSVICLDGF